MNLDQQQAYELLIVEVRTAFETRAPMDSAEDYEAAKNMMVASAQGLTPEVALALGMETMRIILARCAAGIELAKMRRRDEG